MQDLAGSSLTCTASNIEVAIYEDIVSRRLRASHEMSTDIQFYGKHQPS